MSSASSNHYEGDSAITRIADLQSRGLLTGRLCRQNEENRLDPSQPSRGTIDFATIKDGVLTLHTETHFRAVSYIGVRTVYHKVPDKVMAVIPLDSHTTFEVWADGYFISHPPTNVRASIT